MKKKIPVSVVFAVLVLVAVLFVNAYKQNIRHVFSEREDGRSFLAGYGWETAEEPLETIAVTLPDEEDLVHKEYNRLQKAQGFDLSPYCGKQVVRYTYAVLNHKEKGEVRANILFYNGKIIGGDICSVAIDGFMHGVNEREYAG